MARRRTTTARRRAGAGRAAPASTVRTTPVPGSVRPDVAGDGAMDDARDSAPEPEALVVSDWFDSGVAGEPYSATVRFTGRRALVAATPDPGDTFTQDETIDRVVPGTGPVSISTWVYGLRPGEWSVTAELIGVPGGEGASSVAARDRHTTARPVHRAAWSWRHWAVSAAPETALRTRWAVLAPLARIPAVVRGSYPALAAVGTFLALVIQSVILADQGVGVGPSLGVSLLTIVLGLVGAKLWYAALHPDEALLRGGWAVDGFLVVAPLVALVALHVSNLPIRAYLDAVTPGLFFAVAIGRVGCFLTGCCAGRPTRSRWGVWSSDGRVGARRIPTQLLESLAGLLVGVVSLAIVLGSAFPIDGLAFVTAFAVYAAVRQVLLRLRVERRASPRSIPLTAGAVAAVLVVVAVVSFAHPGGRPSVATGPLASHAEGRIAVEA
jgi:phosphatidylglycerol---prolipoprotein diacylglyceryl transferase